MQLFTLALAAFSVVLATIAVGLALGAHRRLETWAGHVRRRRAVARARAYAEGR